MAFLVADFTEFKNIILSHTAEEKTVFPLVKSIFSNSSSTEQQEACSLQQQVLQIHLPDRAPQSLMATPTGSSSVAMMISWPALPSMRQRVAHNDSSLVVAVEASCKKQFLH